LNLEEGIKTWIRAERQKENHISILGLTAEGGKKQNSEHNWNEIN